VNEILLINPPQTRLLLTTEREQSLSAVLPLGLAYLAAVLERDGYQVGIVDMMAEGMRVSSNSSVPCTRIVTFLSSYSGQKDWLP
jgi:hypothetical protein